MPRLYSVSDDQACTATPGDTVITIQGAVTVRPEVYELVLGTTGTPGDQAIEWFIRYFDTDDGTGTSLTAVKLDTLDASSAVTLQGNHTTEPSSFIGTLMQAGVHQRATFHWRAQSGRGFKIAAVATEGIGVTPINASYTGLCTSTVMWAE